MIEKYEVQSEFLRRFIQEGVRQGVQQGERALLLRQLRPRFGELPPQRLAQLEAAAQAELERWADAILTATSLDEVFATP